MSEENKQHERAPLEKEVIDWNKPLVDSDGNRHTFISQSSIEAVTQLQGSFAFATWSNDGTKCFKSMCRELTISNSSEYLNLAAKAIEGEKRLVVVESPFAGDVEKNIAYARAAVRDSLLRGEAPIASHLLYTQEGILNDDIPQERQQGIDAGLAWRTVSSGTVVYVDYGVSKGMEYGITKAKESGKSVEYRTIAGWSKKDTGK